MMNSRALFGENLKVKGVFDKLFKETLTEMIMHSYYTSGVNFVSDFRRMFNDCTENRPITISEELYKNTLERGIKRRMPITWGKFTHLEPISATTMSAGIASSAKGNYMYTTKAPGPDSEEDASEIGSDGENELYPLSGCMNEAEDENI